jgi:hypothetical protein
MTPEKPCGEVRAAEPRLMARIKRTSKYYGQTPPGEWFDVRFVDDGGYPVLGNHNRYRLSDVILGVRLGERVLDLNGGKKAARSFEQ